MRTPQSMRMGCLLMRIFHRSIYHSVARHLGLKRGTGSVIRTGLCYLTMHHIVHTVHVIHHHIIHTIHTIHTIHIVHTIHITSLVSHCRRSSSHVPPSLELSRLTGSLASPRSSCTFGITRSYNRLLDSSVACTSHSLIAFRSFLTSVRLFREA